MADYKFDIDHSAVTEMLNSAQVQSVVRSTATKIQSAWSGITIGDDVPDVEIIHGETEGLTYDRERDRVVVRHPAALRAEFKDSRFSSSAGGS